MKRSNNVRAMLSAGALGLLAVSSPAFSQWNLFGNAAVAGNFLGTTNAITLDIRTNGATRMTINGVSGDVNILRNLLVNQNTATNSLNVNGGLSNFNGGPVTLLGGSSLNVNGGVSNFNGGLVNFNVGPVTLNPGTPLNVNGSPASFTGGATNFNNGTANFNSTPVQIVGAGGSLDISAGYLRTTGVPVDFRGGIVTVGVAGGVGEALDVVSGHLDVNNGIPLDVNGGPFNVNGGAANFAGGPVTLMGGSSLNVNGGASNFNGGSVMLNGGAPLLVNGGPVNVNGGALSMFGGPVLMNGGQIRNAGWVGVNTGAGVPVNSVDVGGNQVIGAGYVAAAVVAPTNSLLVEGDLYIGYTVNPGTYKLAINGTSWANGGYFGSDSHWKENITPVTGALAKVMKLQGVNYDFRKIEKLNFPEGRQLGFIAQEVEKVVPEVVATNSEGYKGVAYQNLTALLTEAVKEQQGQIVRLNAQIEQLQAAIVKLGGSIAPVQSGTSTNGHPELK